MISWPVAVFFSRVTHPILGPGSAFFGRGPWGLLALFPCSYSVPGLPGLISCCICLRVLSTRLVARLISQSFSLGDRPLWPAIWALFWAFFPFWVRFLSLLFFDSNMVFLCSNTCVVHVPAAIISHEKPWVLSFLEEVVDFSKLSAVQFVPRGLISLTFKELADKEHLVSQGSVMLENVECSAVSSMDAEDSHVSSGPPSVPVVKVTPSTLGVSLLAAVEGMDSDNESVDNVSVINGESKNESSNSMDIVNETNVVKENVVNEKVVKINEINVDKENESNDSQASGSMECSGSPSISSFSSPSEPPNSVDQLLAAGCKRLNRSIIPSAAVAVASIVKRSKAVPRAGVQKKKTE